jgi:hypothetical protein
LWSVDNMVGLVRVCHSVALFLAKFVNQQIERGVLGWPGLAFYCYKHAE